MEKNYPLIDTSLHEGQFMYPIGVVVQETPPPELLPAGNTLGYHVAPPNQHSRGLSNSTMATADIRLAMKRSITDLFTSIGEVQV